MFTAAGVMPAGLRICALVARETAYVLRSICSDSAWLSAPGPLPAITGKRGWHTVFGQSAPTSSIGGLAVLNCPLLSGTRPDPLSP